jgi:serine/threonine protein kinase
MDNYVILEEICQTQFSKILKVKNKKTKSIAVLKQIMQKNSEESPNKETLREILVMMNFSHPHIVKYNSVFVYKLNVVIEMEYCVTTLSNLVRYISKPFHTGQIKKIIRSIAEGLKYLHENDIMHRDLKPGNILINENCDIKLGDFGSSRIITPSIKEVTPQIGTKWYKAPEIIFGKKDYGKYVDIWSFGCLAAELFMFEPLFPGNTDFEMVNFIFSLLGYSQEDEEVLKPQIKFEYIDAKENSLQTTLDCADSDFIDLLKKMLVLNYEKRISINEVLEHEFLKSDKEYMNVNLPI